MNVSDFALLSFKPKEHIRNYPYKLGDALSMASASLSQLMRMLGQTPFAIGPANALAGGDSNSNGKL
jgi:hypothetical protein